MCFKSIKSICNDFFEHKQSQYIQSTQSVCKLQLLNQPIDVDSLKVICIQNNSKRLLRYLGNDQIDYNILLNAEY